MITAPQVRHAADAYIAETGQPPEVMVVHPSRIREEGRYGRVRVMASPIVPPAEYWIGTEAELADALPRHYRRIEEIEHVN